ncbi:MAG TPA: RodZ domain-containing protein [Pseudomonadales bacterium]|nr:RodZ domain-containing protein [Pseudomonadales bacterium]
MIVAESSAEKQVSDLAGIGRALRQGRIAKDMSVETAALELHLQIRQINALEKGDFGGFNGPVFIKGYLRACAKLYGLDGDNLVSFYDSFLPQPKMYTSVIINSKKHLLAPRYNSKAVMSVSVLIVSVAFILSLFWLGSHYWSEAFLDRANNALRSVFNIEDIQPQTSETLDAIRNISPQGAVVAAAVDAPVTLPSLAENSVPASNDSQTVMAPEESIQDSVLHIEFIDDCWVQLKADDGTVLHEKVHKKGEVFDMAVKPPLHVWFGRSAAVNVSYNGVVVQMPVKQGFQSAQFILGDDSSSSEIE